MCIAWGTKLGASFDVLFFEAPTYGIKVYVLYDKKH